MQRIFLILATAVLVIGCGKQEPATTAGAGGGASVAGSDDAWPRKPIKVIVPFSPGGSTDQTVRVIQKGITDNNLLAQRLTVINVTGHFSVGCRKAKSAKPDGYTFLVVHKGLMGGQASGLIDFGHADFEPVAETTTFSVVTAVREDSPWKTLGELLAETKSKPDTVIFGANLGALNHMAGVLMQETTPGAQFRFVQIGGGTANFTAMTGGHIHVSSFSTSEYLSFKSKGLRGLSYSGEERHPKLPEVPTSKELGHDMSYSIGSWWFAPKGTPQEAIDGLAETLKKSLETEYVKQQFGAKAVSLTFLSGEEFRARLDSEWTQTQSIADKMKKKAE
jgi:tripartite-type tricarboxylate transporter receptor subunit TctC